MKLARSIRALAIAAGVTGLAEMSLPETAHAQGAKPAAKAAPATKLLATPVTFESGIRLDGIESTRDGSGNPVVQFSWSATKDAPRDRMVAVHLNDAAGKMAGQFDHALDKGNRPAKSGEKWTTIIPLPDAKKTPTMGVALYQKDRVDGLQAPKTVKTDWGGKRLVVPLK